MMNTTSNSARVRLGTMRCSHGRIRAVFGEPEPGDFVPALQSCVWCDGTGEHFRLKRLTVSALEWLCERTHFVTLHRPWLWLFHWCPFAELAERLDQRWQTGVWQEP